MPLPAWAGTFFRKILQDYIRGEVPDLGIAFGLKGARGKDSRFHKELIQRRDHHLSRQVRFFCLRGDKIKPACTFVADRIAKECRRDNFNETIYLPISRPLQPETLRPNASEKNLSPLAQVDKELTLLHEAEVIKDSLFSHLFASSSPS